MNVANKNVNDEGGTHIIKVINKGVQQHYRGECTALSIASEQGWSQVLFVGFM